MESEAFRVTNPQVELPVEVSTPSRGSFPRRVLEDRRRDTPVSLRLGLQRRAPNNLRRHVWRAAQRFTVLVLADLASFYVMRALLRAVRDDVVLGVRLGSELAAVLPRGILNGWQFAAALFVALFVTGNYGAGDQRRSVRRLFLAAALATALPLWMTIWTSSLDVVAIQYLLTVGLVWMGLAAERLTLDRLIVGRAPSKTTAARTLFVGSGEECRAARVGSAFRSDQDFSDLGFVDVHVPPAADALGHIVDFAQVLHDLGPEIIVICGYLPDGRFQDVVETGLAAGCQILSVPRAIEVAGVQPTVVWKRRQPLIELNRPVAKAPALFTKRVADLIASSAGLLFLSPLFLLVGLLIKIDSAGPVFFASERWGQGGRRIRIWKFRTMVKDAVRILDTDKSLSAAYSEHVKLRLDPRTTRLGKWLRRLSIDELPQLFNVLTGEMSLVGPRPKLLGEEQRYGPLLPTVLSVPPGITGLWQVSGRNNLTYDERIALDVDYVRRCSLILDFKILLQTVPVVTRGVGAL